MLLARVSKGPHSFVSLPSPASEIGLVQAPAASKAYLCKQTFTQGWNLTFLWGNKTLRSFCSNTNVSASFVTRESRRCYFCLIASNSSPRLGSGVDLPPFSKTSQINETLRGYGSHSFAERQQHLSQHTWEGSQKQEYFVFYFKWQL